MGTLLTQERAAQLVALPKRFLKSSEFTWRYTEPPGAPKPGKRIRITNARTFRARLLAAGSREMFLLSGNSNGSFGFTLKWQEFGLARIDSEPVHRNPPTAGGDREFLNGPHIHYYVPGYGLSFARPTDAFDQTDLNGALRFFLKHCNVVDAPSLQEVLAL